MGKRERDRDRDLEESREGKGLPMTMEMGEQQIIAETSRNNPVKEVIKGKGIRERKQMARVRGW